MANLLERARQHGVRRFVQVSGNQSAVDALALEAYRTHGQEVIITRAGDNYGPFQAPSAFIPAAIIHGLRDAPVAVAGDGSAARGWLQVEDHCSAIFAALLGGEAGTIYPLLNEQKTSDLEVAHAILEYLGKPRELVRLNAEEGSPGPGLSDEEHLAEKQLEWKPRKHFAPALRETVDWYVRNREWWDRRPFGQETEPERIAL
jgi:dTDP-glucose 4,6-dehydratase